MAHFLQGKNIHVKLKLDISVHVLKATNRKSRPKQKMILLILCISTLKHMNTRRLCSLPSVLYSLRGCSKLCGSGLLVSQSRVERADAIFFYKTVNLDKDKKKQEFSAIRWLFSLADSTQCSSQPV